ncbi:MAG: hypothetical protein LQ349_007498 [Xanthoria aureola]|nr:MAG: hypothetical protein LQ349_007498 [Xanthoria aureola]
MTTTQIFFEEATTTTSTTTSVATSTVPTAAGFTPLASASGYVAKRSSEDAAAPAIRGRRMEERAAPRKLSCPQVGKPGSFGQFPQSVICGALVIAKTTSTRTFTATNKATTTLPVATSTITSTTTITSTSISAALPATTTTTTTLSFSTTELASSKSTTTATQTVTVIEASSTIYAACAPNNIINHANNNQGITTIYSTGQFQPTTTSEVAIAEPIACCEQCQKTPGCTGFAQYPGGGQARCFFFTVVPGQYNAASNLGQFFQSNAGFEPRDGYTMGNGPCGQLGNRGSS